MTSTIIQLQDTGKNVNNPQVFEYNVANDGAKLSLKVESLSFEQQSIVDDSDATEYVENNQNNFFEPCAPKKNGLSVADITLNAIYEPEEIGNVTSLIEFLNTKGQIRLFCQMAKIRDEENSTAEPYFLTIMNDIRIERTPDSTGDYFLISVSFTEIPNRLS